MRFWRLYFLCQVIFQNLHLIRNELYNTRQQYEYKIVFVVYLNFFFASFSTPYPLFYEYWCYNPHTLIGSVVSRMRVLIKIILVKSPPFVECVLPPGGRGNYCVSPETGDQLDHTQGPKGDLHGLVMTIFLFKDI